MSESRQYRSPAEAGRRAAGRANAAAWLRRRGGGFEVGPAPYTPPKENQIAVRNHAVAVNPLDWGIQLAGSFLYRWLRYPAVWSTSRPRSTRR